MEKYLCRELKTIHILRRHILAFCIPLSPMIIIARSWRKLSRYSIMLGCRSMAKTFTSFMVALKYLWRNIYVENLGPFIYSHKHISAFLNPLPPTIIIKCLHVMVLVSMCFTSFISLENMVYFEGKKVKLKNQKSSTFCRHSWRKMSQYSIMLGCRSIAKMFTSYLAFKVFI